MAAERAEQIRRNAAEIAIPYEGRLVHATLSLGVAAYPDHGQDVQAVIGKADQALYQSKRDGRNRVTAWQDGAPPMAG